MGKEARIKKLRYCQSCEREHNVTAERMVEHAIYCKRLDDIGLITADSIIEPIDKMVVV